MPFNVKKWWSLAQPLVRLRPDGTIFLMPALKLLTRHWKSISREVHGGQIARNRTRAPKRGPRGTRPQIRARQGLGSPVRYHES